MKSKIIFTAGLVGLIIPSITMAATQRNLATFAQLIIVYLNTALVLMMGLAFVMFVWYVIQYFIKPNEGAENRKEGGLYILYSLLGFFAILSFWGFVNILQNSFGLSNTSNAPSSWGAFSNIFPGGNSSGSANPASGSSNINNTNTGELSNPAYAPDYSSVPSRDIPASDSGTQQP